MLVETNIYKPSRGDVKIFNANDPSQVFFSQHNVIANNIRYLFARLLTDRSEPNFGVWGYAFGAGDPSWTAENVPAAQSTQQVINSPILRKRLSSARFCDKVSDTIFSPTANAQYSLYVDFQTIVNANTDELIQPISEIGLIGGGSALSNTQMMTAPFWLSENLTQQGTTPAATPAEMANTVTLMTYITFKPLQLPPDINIGFSWVMSF